MDDEQCNGSADRKKYSKEYLVSLADLECCGQWPENLDADTWREMELVPQRSWSSRPPSPQRYDDAHKVLQQEDEDKTASLGAAENDGDADYHARGGVIDEHGAAVVSDKAAAGQKLDVCTLFMREARGILPMPDAPTLQDIERNIISGSPGGQVKALNQVQAINEAGSVDGTHSIQQLLVLLQKGSASIPKHGSVHEQVVRTANGVDKLCKNTNKGAMPFEQQPGDQAGSKIELSSKPNSAEERGSDQSEAKNIETASSRTPPDAKNGSSNHRNRSFNRRRNPFNPGAYTVVQHHQQQLRSAAAAQPVLLVPGFQASYRQTTTIPVLEWPLTGMMKHQQQQQQISFPQQLSYSNFMYPATPAPLVPQALQALQRLVDHQLDILNSIPGEVTPGMLHQRLSNSLFSAGLP